MSLLDSLKEKITHYFDVYIRLAKLNFIERTSSVMGFLVFALINMFLFFCIMLFLGLGLVEVSIVLIDSKLASFFIVIGVYLLIMLVIFMQRRKIIRFFASSFIKVLTEHDEDEEDEELKIK